MHQNSLHNAGQGHSRDDISVLSSPSPTIISAISTVSDPCAFHPNDHVWSSTQHVPAIGTSVNCCHWRLMQPNNKPSSLALNLYLEFYIDVCKMNFVDNETTVVFMLYNILWCVMQCYVRYFMLHYITSQHIILQYIMLYQYSNKI